MEKNKKQLIALTIIFVIICIYGMFVFVDACIQPGEIEYVDSANVDGSDFSNLFNAGIYLTNGVFHFFTFIVYFLFLMLFESILAIILKKVVFRSLYKNDVNIDKAFIDKVKKIMISVFISSCIIEIIFIGIWKSIFLFITNGYWTLIILTLFIRTLKKNIE